MLLSACTHTASIDTDEENRIASLSTEANNADVKGPQVLLSDHVFYTLSAPPVAMVESSQTHLVETNVKGKQQSFIAQVEYSVDKITMAAVTISGIPLFDFVWQNNKPAVSNEYISLPGLQINYVVADLQWVNWPIEMLVDSVSNADFSGALVSNEKPQVLQKNTSGDNWLRTVTHNKQLLLTVEKVGNHYHLSHINRGYSLDITDLSEGIK